MPDLIWTIGSIASLFTALVLVSDIILILVTHGRQGYKIARVGHPRRGRFDPGAPAGYYVPQRLDRGSHE